MARRCVKTLRGQERSLDCGDIRRRLRRRDLARARAEPAAAAAARARPAKKPREKASGGERGPQMKKVSDEPMDYQGVSKPCPTLSDRKERNETVHGRSFRSWAKKRVLVHAEFRSPPANSSRTVTLCTCHGTIAACWFAISVLLRL